MIVGKKYDVEENKRDYLMMPRMGFCSRQNSYKILGLFKWPRYTEMIIWYKKLIICDEVKSLYSTYSQMVSGGCNQNKHLTQNNWTIEKEKDKTCYLSIALYLYKSNLKKNKKLIQKAKWYTPMKNNLVGKF